MKNTMKYIFSDKVDIILLLSLIALFIRNAEKNWELASLCIFFALYIIAVIFRMSKSKYLINNYIYDKRIRAELHLSPIPGEFTKTKRTIFALIVDILFWIVLVAILTFIIINL